MNLLGKTKMLIVGAVVAAMMLTSCGETHNTLTEKEKSEGWQLLFDGKTLNGWRDYNGTELTEPWHVVDGTIQAKGEGSDGSGYIVTDKEYTNFELQWDFKLSKGGNSGMIYHVVERPEFKVPYVQDLNFNCLTLKISMKQIGSWKTGKKWEWIMRCTYLINLS